MDRLMEGGSAEQRGVRELLQKREHDPAAGRRITGAAAVGAAESDSAALHIGGDDGVGFCTLLKGSGARRHPVEADASSKAMLMLMASRGMA